MSQAADVSFVVFCVCPVALRGSRLYYLSWSVESSCWTSDVSSMFVLLPSQWVSSVDCVGGTVEVRLQLLFVVRPFAYLVLQCVLVGGRDGIETSFPLVPVVCRWPFLVWPLDLFWAWEVVPFSSFYRWSYLLPVHSCDVADGCDP